MSNRGGYGGTGRGRGGRRSDQRQEHSSSGSVVWPALQSSGGGRGAPVSGGRGRGNVGRGDTKTSVASSSKEQTKVSESDSVSALAKLQITPAEIEPRVRPGIGLEGTNITVRANHFLVKFADRDLCHYDVSISPEVKSKKVNRDVMKTLVDKYKASHLAGKSPAYDGRKSLYTAGPFPFQSKEFLVNLEDNRADGSSGNERQFKVVIKLVSKPSLYQLREFLFNRYRDAPYETVHLLDVVLRDWPSQKSFYNPCLGMKDVLNGGKGELGNGIEYWRGYFQSLRPTQMGLSLNIDVSARSFYEPITVTEFISKYLGVTGFKFNRLLTRSERIKVTKVLKNLTIILVHLNYPKSAKISGISEFPISRLSFKLEDETEKPVIQYFREKYKHTVQNPSLPAIQVVKKKKTIYLPMELCQIAEGQRYTKRLNEKQVTALLNATCQGPVHREKAIKEMVKNNEYNKISLVREEFGLSVTEKLSRVNARVLPPPSLKYHGSREVNPQLGNWKMTNEKMFEGATVNSWTCVNFSKRERHLEHNFCNQLIGMCNRKGMQFNPQPVIPFLSDPPQSIEEALRDINKKARDLQLLIVILPDDETGSYGKIKRICETELGIVSQCCKPIQAAKLNNQYMANVALKINVKTGGKNTVLYDAFQEKFPIITDFPTIIMGADVTHPQPGEDSTPSIAVVVASMDWPHIAKYRGLVSAQAPREEIIQDLYKLVQDPQGNYVHSGLIREHLLAFCEANGNTMPERIIFFRDGVSEGQFNQVRLHEVTAIRKACDSIKAGYHPRITFVVVQKRHHTRLFPDDDKNHDRSGNILPGTVVDTKICHPKEFDFYLNSHAGVQGTSRPAHYHVLYDENNFSADALQKLTNNLCYTFARCTRSVSYVPPAYYAHLAAFRARYYIESEMSDGASSSTTTSTSPVVSHLPAIKDNVKNVMYYC